MSRPELIRWERQMRRNFKASNFDLCPNDVKVCYLEERMDASSQQLLRKLCNGEPERYGMEILYEMIREKVVRTASLQQRRVTEMLNFRQRQGELFDNFVQVRREQGFVVHLHLFTVQSWLHVIPELHIIQILSPITNIYKHL